MTPWNISYSAVRVLDNGGTLGTVCRRSKVWSAHHRRYGGQSSGEGRRSLRCLGWGSVSAFIPVRAAPRTVTTLLPTPGRGAAAALVRPQDVAVPQFTTPDTYTGLWQLGAAGEHVCRVRHRSDRQQR